MKIRGKLMALLLFFAAIPLLLSTAISHFIFYDSGLHLAGETERELSRQAHTALRIMTNGFQRLQERDRRMMETALSLPTGRATLNVTEAAPPDSPPPLAYSALQSYRPGTVSRQITIREDGSVRCYPPDNPCFDDDPKRAPWYQRTRDLQTTTRTLASDPVTGEPALVVAQPLRGPKGHFAGATALVRPVKDMFADLRLASETGFAASARMLVAADPDADASAGGLRILAAEQSSAAAGDAAPEQALLRPDTPEETRLLLQRIGAGRGGSLELDFQGVRTHWIFSAAAGGEPFALILVPHSQVTAQAVAARKHVVAKTVRGLEIAGALLIATIVAVFFTAMFASKKVTRPLDQLATAAQSLAGGDYRARATIDTGDEIEELGRVFNQVGPALAERERMASALALAGDIQRHLLPQTQPEIEDFEIFGGAVPCDETGGDYYDFISLDDDRRLALAVGDVSGHGVGAALLMAGARGVLRSHALRRDCGLPQLFATLNRHLCRDTADEQFMTLFYAVLQKRALHWCSAGHGPLFLYRCGEQKITELGSTGLPLGVIADTTWDEGTPVVFQSGDILLAGTDGIWEARNPAGETLGTERVKSRLRLHAAKSAAQIHASIMELVKDFQSGHQEDDMTLTVIKAL